MLSVADFHCPNRCSLIVGRLKAKAFNDLPILVPFMNFVVLWIGNFISHHDVI
jgi:hypothetical protein